MKRPVTLKDPAQTVRASDVLYDAAGRMTQLKYPNNNRITGSGYSYDGLGRVTRIQIPGCSATLSYAPDNRLRTVITPYVADEHYAYAPSGEQVYKRTETETTTERVIFNGPDGRRLGQYKLVVGTSAITFTTEFINLYFAGKPIYRSQFGTSHSALVTDRLGSMVHNGVRPQSYYPYGEEKSTITGSNQDRFATYYRDAFTNFDYAIERYYHSGSGRFLTPDPYRASAGPADPGSWNRYAYVQGDPVNSNDPSGLCIARLEPPDPGGSPWIHFSPFDPISRFDREQPVGGGRGGQPRRDGREDCYRDAGENLSSAQLALLGDFSWNSLGTGERAAFLNFTANAAATGLDLSGFTAKSFGSDRIVLGGEARQVGTFQDAIKSNPLYVSSTTDPLVGVPHAGYEYNFRQDVATYSMQVNIDTIGNRLEFDIDKFNPAYGLAPLIGHGLGEYFPHKLFNTTTSPYSAAQALRRRGIDLGHDCP